MSRWARGATLATFGAVLLMPSMLRPIAASADDGCPVLGPGCVVDTVDDLVDGTTEPVDEVSDIVDDISDGVTGGVEVVIDDTLGVVPDEPGDGGGGAGDGGGGGAGSGGGAIGDAGSSGDGPSLTGRHRRTLGPPKMVPPPARGAPSVAMPSAGTGVDPRAVTAEGPTVGIALVRTVAGVAVLLMLLGLLAGFVSFQHALDRRDPKLAPDTLGSDRVPFG